MNIRALSYDLARCQRAHLPHLKAVVDQLAEHGFNMMSINLEHKFDFQSAPGLAPPGSLTQDMARELVAYGKARGVIVVPQPNLIGHCEGMGSTERYGHLMCDTFQQMPWGGYEQVNMELPEVRKMLKRMMADICRAFPGEYIHIGGDEVRQTHHLFPGDKEKTKAKVVEYFLFLVELGRSTGRQVIMWGDMPIHYPELVAALPKNVVVAHWAGYGDKWKEGLKNYKDAGFRVLTCPAPQVFCAFAAYPEGTRADMQYKIDSVRDVGGEGFMLNSWENGRGSCFDVSWPLIAMAGAMARGEKIETWQPFTARYAEKRYGVNGADFVHLHELLSDRFEAIMSRNGQYPNVGLVTLRQSLFRAANPISSIARRREFEFNRHLPVWEISPFFSWLYIRAVLDKAMLKQMEALGKDVARVAAKLKASATMNNNELQSLLDMADAYGILVERLRILDAAKQEYHRASAAQGKSAAAFRASLKKVAAALESLRPGIKKIKAMANRMDATYGWDPGEKQWLVLHEQSLDRHIAAVKKFDFKGDSLLEFGEFLKRPVGITQRLTWR